jgi:mutator protein MutT
MEHIAQQPTLAIGAVVFKDDEVLLVQRKQPPSQGQWALPGGKVHWGETLQQAAEREIKEETGVTIHAGEVVHQFEIIERDRHGQVQFHYFIVDLEGGYLHGHPHARDDALEARWVGRGEFDALTVNEYTRALLQQKYDFP